MKYFVEHSFAGLLLKRGHTKFSQIINKLYIHWNFQLLTKTQNKNKQCTRRTSWPPWPSWRRVEYSTLLPNITEHIRNLVIHYNRTVILKNGSQQAICHYIRSHYIRLCYKNFIWIWQAGCHLKIFRFLVVTYLLWKIIDFKKFAVRACYMKEVMKTYGEKENLQGAWVCVIHYHSFNVDRT